MRFKVKNENGDYIFIRACMWPNVRCINKRPSHHCVIRATISRDKMEVEEYLEDNPGASWRDVQMCCFLGNTEAGRILHEIKETHSINNLCITSLPEEAIPIL
jgi:hypothetical protein